RRVDAAVAVRDRFEGDVIDARESGRRTVYQTRQFAAVLPRQVPLGEADLLVDEVEVVEQPFRRRGDAPPGRGCFRQQVAGAQQEHLVGGQPRQQQVVAGALGDLVRTREHAPV